MEADDFFEIIFSDKLELSSRLDYIFEIIDDKLLIEDYNYVDQVLKISKDNFIDELVDELALGIAFLTVTLYCGKLNNREEFGKKLKERYEEENEVDPIIFKNLI